MSEYCRILIVEDEYLTRQGIKHLINWEREGFKVVGEATNGQEGLKLVEEFHPHIVLTDVVMPVMDGIAFTKELWARYPDVRVIVLSGFSDFTYVKSTFQHGAVDYILKPTLNPQDLLNTLKKAASQIPSFVLSRGGGDSLETQMNQLLSGFGVEEAMEGLRGFFPYPRFFLVGMHVPYALGNTANLAQQNALLAAAAEEFLPGVAAKTVVVDQKLLLLVVNYTAEPYRALTERVKRMAASLKSRTPKAFYVYSREFSGLNHLKETYQQHFVAYTRQRFYDREAAVLAAESFENTGDAPVFDAAKFTAEVRGQQYREAVDRLCDYVQEARKRRAPGEFELKSLLQDALYQILSAWEEQGLDPEGIGHLKRDCFIRVSEARYAEDLTVAFEMIRADFAALVEKYALRSEHQTMQEILDYVAEHYAEPLTLNVLAKKFNFNYSYLSSYFAQHNREGFSEYLNRERIRRAEELLRKEDIPVSEVCGMVGYGDHSYFCKVFKKFTGKTPSQFRKQYGAASGGGRI